MTNRVRPRNYLAPSQEKLGDFPGRDCSHVLPLLVDPDYECLEYTTGLVRLRSCYSRLAKRFQQVGEDRMSKGLTGGVTWTYDVRSLSEVPRQIKLDGWRRADSGAVSIEPLEVSCWRGWWR